MKATAIYIPELGRVFFIEEIISISNITTFKNDNEVLGSFEIVFKCRKNIKISNFTTESGDYDDYYYEKFNIEILKSIRNQFLQHCNIINAQETDKEQPLLNNEEYHLICKLLSKEGINSGRIFYVLNRMVDDTVRTAQIT